MATAVAVPVDPPKQVTLVAVAEADGPPEFDNVAVAVPVHPFEAVTKMLYVPTVRPVKVAEA